MKKDLIIYGGSFNPPTIAHKAIIEYLASRFKDKTLMIMPTNNLFKKSNKTSFLDRFNMLKITLKELGLDNKPDVYISDYESDPSDFKGTLYTLRAFNHPYFVIGADVMADMTNWPESDKLLKENYFIVMPRKDYYFMDIVNNDNLIKQYINHFIFVNDSKVTGISSSEYRKTKNESLLSSGVLDYIKKNNLYND